MDRFEAKYKWRPVEHSIEQVDKVNRYIESLGVKNSKGDVVWDDSTFDAKTKRWIQNERAMCILNFEYYLTRYHYIATENTLMRFKFRSGQRVLFNVIKDLEDKGNPIEIQLLKARQGGFSTLVEALMTHRALFSIGVKASIASVDDQKTYEMMTMMYTALENLPWWLPPQQTKDKRSGKAMLEFAHVGSSIVIQSGSMRTGIGQGTTPTAIHLSELCDYPDAEVQVEEGLFKAVHAGPHILMILESTGNGNTGWWARQWLENKEFYFQGRSRLYPLFIPWFLTPELYPKAEWLKEFPIPKGWEPNSRTIATANRCEAYARNSEAITRVIGKEWTMPIEQKWFWEFNYESALRRGAQKSWLRHMPCDDFEALIGKNDSVFDRETISGIDKGRKHTVDVYGLIGDGIAEKHDPAPHEVDYQKERIAVPWKTPGDVRLEWILMPLRGDTESKGFDPLKKLLIYHHPEKGARYSISVDPGTGVGGDRTAMTVNRDGTDACADVQVAEFAADDISNVEVFAWVAAIAAYYGQYMEDEQPRIIIEQKRKFGDSCYHALKLHGFRNHHKFRRYDIKTLRVIQTTHSPEGWFTNEWSRPMLLNAFKNAVENGWFEVNSRWLLEEIKGFEQSSTESGKTRMDHQQGKHDDRIFAAAMSYFTLHDMDVMAERAKKRYSKAQDEGYEVDYSPWVQSVPNPGAEAFFDSLEDAA